MRVSKTLWVEEGVKWTYFNKRQLIKKNKYKGNVYLVCSSPCKHWLFEIIEAKDLTSRYEACCLLGISLTKVAAIEYVAGLLDAIYNKQIMDYQVLTT